MSHQPPHPLPGAAAPEPPSADADAAEAAPESPPVLGPATEGLSIAFVPGIMPSKWFGRWQERFGARIPLRSLPLPEDQDPLVVLERREAHAVLLRPERAPASRDRERWNAVPLYREQPVVVLPADHVLTLLEEVPVAELAAERLLQDPAEVPAWARLRAEHLRAAGERERPLPAMRHTGDAVELVAAGLGLLVVPMSVARLHHRRDLVHRPVPDLPETQVHLVWPRLPEPQASEEEAAAEEAVIQEFVGITRGRRAGSTRGGAAPAERPAPAGQTTRLSGARTAAGSRGSRSPSSAPRRGTRSRRRGRRSPR
ncbi:transcriptional regulator [Rothia kristinae]|uniref:Transcriptional regulator n=1 Tax=Rothia kristinae TaxID=37923 RepID=A0A7T4T492_9MICC|nr:LysR substrate-binding domain-containing protein [Rothia kristinae]QQC59178.1 transcriptional regulator [Rothia kristinae]